MTTAIQQPDDAEQRDYAVFAPRYGREYLRPTTSIGSGDLGYEGSSLERAKRELARTHCTHARMCAEDEGFRDCTFAHRIYTWRRYDWKAVPCDLEEAIAALKDSEAAKILAEAAARAAKASHRRSRVARQRGPKRLPAEEGS